MSNNFDAFCAQFGEDVGNEILEMICDANCTGSFGPVHISKRYRHNACNYTISGHVEHANERFYFVVHNGDWNGTVVEQFGKEDEVIEYVESKPTLYTFVPNNPRLKFEKPHMWQIYLLWRNEKWFTEKVRGYNYDRHFAPGLKTEQHYFDFAKSKGMIIATEEDFEYLMSQNAV